MVVPALVLLQELRLHQEVERFGNFRRRDFLLAGTGYFERFCAGHVRSQFADYRVFPRLEIIELLTPEDAHLVGVRQGTTFLERGALGFVILGMRIRYHKDKVVVFETDQPHGVCHRTCRPDT